MLLAVAVFAFVFVSLSVGAFRIVDALERHRANREAARRAAILRRHMQRYGYFGPIYNAHGREVA